MLSRSLRMAFWMYYDHLGTFLFLNVLLALPLALPVWLGAVALVSGDPVLRGVVGLPLLLLTAGVLWPLGLVGTLAFARQLIDERSANLSDFFLGVRRYGLAAVAVGLFYVVASMGLLFAGWFYAARVGATLPWLGYVLSAAAGWVLVLLWLSAPWAMTALVFRRAGARKALRLGVSLVLGHPGMGVAVGLGTGVLLVTALAPPGFLLFSVAPVAVWWAAAYELLARRYAVAGGQPLVWTDANDDYLNRGWSDLLFPWKT